jgi:hypothetical protein
VEQRRPTFVAAHLVGIRIGACREQALHLRRLVATRGEDQLLLRRHLFGTSGQCRGERGRERQAR